MVDVSQIPIHIVVGAQLRVSTCNDSTELWLRSLLLNAEDSHTTKACWETASPESPVGILLSVRSSSLGTSGYKATEVLLYATRSKDTLQRPPSPGLEDDDARYNAAKDTGGLQVRAIMLCSDLLSTHSELTPPTSPVGSSADVEAIFLPLPTTMPEEVVNKPPVRKRRNVDDAFDEAEQRRKKVRSQSGEAFAARRTESQGAAALHHRGSLSGSTSHAVPLQTRPLSRSPSIASSRPATARAASEMTKRSSLSHMESVACPLIKTDMESKNRDIISRVIMAGMRLYGLVQSKSRKPQVSSATASPAPERTFEQLENDNRKDDDYKLVYHQAFKGVCFAFRDHLGVVTLQPHTEAIRDNVDKLLALYCNDPLAKGLPGTMDEFTPGGRKAFGSAVVQSTNKESPFLLQSGSAHMHVP